MAHDPRAILLPRDSSVHVYAQIRLICSNSNECPLQAHAAQVRHRLASYFTTASHVSISVRLITPPPCIPCHFPPPCPCGQHPKPCAPHSTADASMRASLGFAKPSMVHVSLEHMQSSWQQSSEQWSDMTSQQGTHSTH